jgi:hypothetical protein
VLNRLRQWFDKDSLGSQTLEAKKSASVVNEIECAGVPVFDLRTHLTTSEGLPALDWDAVYSWLDTTEDEAIKAEAWGKAEHAWLTHMREALGGDYRLIESDQSIVLSSLTSSAANAMLTFMERTHQRILQILDGVAELPTWGKDILIVFDDDDAYYRYASRYYPDAGEFAFSSGMHISSGCGHYITMKADLSSIEPIIAHESTHGCLGHLPLPLWLNEGLAVNMEARLTGKLYSEWTPEQTRKEHLNFWGTQEIQQFWSGESFQRTDDGNRLSYDLARILVEQFSTDWESFKLFVLAADASDAGAEAASLHLGVDLGSAACSLMDESNLPAWKPILLNQ